MPGHVEHDEEFTTAHCVHYLDPFVRSLRGLRSPLAREALTLLLSALPGRDDYLWLTPFALHFGWLQHKSRSSSWPIGRARTATDSGG